MSAKTPGAWAKGAPEWSASRVIEFLTGEQGQRSAAAAFADEFLGLPYRIRDRVADLRAVVASAAGGPFADEWAAYGSRVEQVARDLLFGLVDADDE